MPEVHPNWSAHGHFKLLDFLHEGQRGTPSDVSASYLRLNEGFEVLEILSMDTLCSSDLTLSARISTSPVSTGEGEKKKYRAGNGRSSFEPRVMIKLNVWEIGL